LLSAVSSLRLFVVEKSGAYPCSLSLQAAGRCRKLPEAARHPDASRVSVAPNAVGLPSEHGRILACFGNPHNIRCLHLARFAATTVRHFFAPSATQLLRQPLIPLCTWVLSPTRISQQAQLPRVFHCLLIATNSLFYSPLSAWARLFCCPAPNPFFEPLNCRAVRCGTLFPTHRHHGFRR
jgi:hypothetical protein